MNDQELWEMYNPDTLKYINPRYMTDKNIIFYLTLELYFQGVKPNVLKH